MAKKTTTTVPADILELYEKLVAQFPDVDRKGASMPYTSLNGHMFSFLTKDGTLAVRLSEVDREAFLKKHKTGLCEQHGRVMQEYVVVPDKLLKKTDELKKYFQKSLDYVSNLKPKPVNKKGVKRSAKKRKTS